MKKIFAIAWKDTILRFTGLLEWLFFLILPIIFTLILGGTTGPSGDPRVRLAVVDQANSSLSQELIQALNQSEAVRPDVMDMSKAEDQFSERSVSSVLIIPSTFTIEQLQIGSIDLDFKQQPNSLNALVAARAVMAITRRISSAVDIAGNSLVETEHIRPFLTKVDRREYFTEALQDAEALMASAPDRIDTVQGATKDQIEYDPRANSSAGQLVTWVWIPLIGISGMFAYERQKGTLRRLLTTPTNKATYLLGTIFGQVASAIVQMTLLVIFGIFVMKLNWGQDPAALAVMMIASALAAAALGTALGTFVKTESQASGLSIMLGMVMALLGGCWYPLEMFPQVVQKAVKILPTSWAMQGLLDIVSRGKGLVEILPTAGVLMGFAVVFFVIGIARFRYE
jgi:ABC-2 type transport system permease protein